VILAEVNGYWAGGYWGSGYWGGGYWGEYGLAAAGTAGGEVIAWLHQIPVAELTHQQSSWRFRPVHSKPFQKTWRFRPSIVVKQSLLKTLPPPQIYPFEERYNDVIYKEKLNRLKEEAKG
jgi:hypothetical protein